MPPIQKIINTFREKGFKITPQRRLLFELLATNGHHPSAEDLYQSVITYMPDISRTTVYSTLNELVDMGFIEPVSGIPHKLTRYDPKTSSHHHLYCQKCGSIVDIDLDISFIEPPSASADGFEISKKQITFFGFCRHCKSNN
jgi:Fur family transcriptional regulator, peroxide stress response regulator